jgi:hypothetical protein
MLLAPSLAFGSEQNAASDPSPAFRPLAAWQPSRLPLLAPGKSWFSGSTDAAPDLTAFFDGQDAGAAASVPAIVALAGAPRPVRHHDFWFKPDPQNNVVFATYDISGKENFASLGYKRAIGGSLDTPGYRFMTSLGVKIRDVDPVLGTRTTRLHAVRAVFGHEWRFSTLSMTVLAGGSFQPASAGTALTAGRAGRFGPVAMVDLWQDWGAGPLGSRFTSVFAMVNQAGRSSYVRIRHGLGLGDQPWRFGPEVAYSTGEHRTQRGTRVQDGWHRARLGLHVSEIPLRSLRFGISCGAERREHRKSAFYAQMGAYMRY